MKVYLFLILLILSNLEFVYPQDAVSSSGLEVTNYKELHYEVYIQGKAIAGVTENRVETKIKLRLMQSGISNSEITSPRLEVTFLFVGQAFSISAELCRWIDFTANNKKYLGVGSTWQESMIGTHGNNASFVMDWLDQILDQFLVEYLEVNTK